MVSHSVFELFNFRNNYLLYNPYVSYEEIDIYRFFDLIFSRNDELPFEDCEGCVRDYQNHKYNAIVTEILESRGTRNFIIFNDLDFLEELKDRKFVITSPLTYIGRNRTANNSRFLYALAFDLDGIGQKEINNLFYQFKKGIAPKPNIVVSSGNGLHLYYIIQEPIALFYNIKKILKKFKKGMIDLLWRYGETSNIKKRQYQGIFQGFRIPETQTKFGKKVRAFYLPNQEFWSIRSLNRWINGDELLSDKELEIIEKACYISNRLSLKEAKEKYPDWYERRIVKGDKSRKKWHIKRDLYDWWKRKIVNNESVVEGHRYYCVMSLAMYGYKCDIPYEEVKTDAYNLLKEMDEKTIDENNHFTLNDIEDALRAYKENYMTFPRKDIEILTGILMPANKRNGRKQETHIKIMNYIRDEINQNKNWRNTQGRPSKLEEVVMYLKVNPQATKYQCTKETGMSKNTVKKYWEEAQEKIKLENDRFKDVYKIFSEIPFKIKRKVYKKVYIHYHSDYCLNNYGKPITTEEERKENIHIDYFYFLLKEMKISDEKLAEEIYKKRVENKNFIKLKQLIKRQGKRTEKVENLSEFYSLIDKAESEEKLKEICSKYDFLPNLELF